VGGNVMVQTLIRNNIYSSEIIKVKIIRIFSYSIIQIILFIANCLIQNYRAHILLKINSAFCGVLHRCAIFIAAFIVFWKRRDTSGRRQIAPEEREESISRKRLQEIPD